ncbi:hypothetical protein [Fimbriiglobus ruber]|uniref:hypothetical protein n=1 Tax=Fimbriiglobus ruber TaxID=1908690 RepID=UPI00137B04FE|nr:hypothetical protein [Fimbriiglobus ruber]
MLGGQPFGDGQFDLALVSHLLLLYSDQLKFEFHFSAILEFPRLRRIVGGLVLGRD